MQKTKRLNDVKGLHELLKGSVRKASLGLFDFRSIPCSLSGNGWFVFPAGLIPASSLLGKTPIGLINTLFVSG